MKAPLERKLEKYLDELCSLDSQIETIRDAEAEAEQLYQVLLVHPDLLQKTRQLASSIPAYDSFKAQQAELENRRTIVGEMLKAISRMMKKAIKYRGWIVKSTSGGVDRSWNIPKIKKLGLHGIIISGKPLLRVTEVINHDVWQAACDSGAIPPEIIPDVYKETPKTRRASVTKDN